MIESIADIKYTYYINLEERQDRNQHVQEQLQKIGIENPIRFNAIKLASGAIGCSMSHLQCIKQAKEQGWPHVFICEDDILFLQPTFFTRQLNNFFSHHKDDWDVLLIAGNNVPPYKPVDDYCVQVIHCQTTTGYIVKEHYYDTLIENYKTGIQQLMLNPSQGIQYAIDKYWFELQAIDRWFLITPLTVTQREDYSDIEKRDTNYSRLLLDLDKVEWLKQQQEFIKQQQQEFIKQQQQAISNQSGMGMKFL